MLNWIIDASLKHRKLVLGLSAVIVFIGIKAVSHLPIDAFPDVTDVMVQVNTEAPALSPEEVEQQITIRVEQTLGALPNLKLMRSMSKFGLSQVVLIFEDGTDIYFARAQVLERIQALELPEGIERPSMGPIATGLGEIYHYIVTAPSEDLTEARIIHDWVIKPQMLSVDGVAEVNSWGGFEKQFQVVVDPVRLIEHGLTLADLVEALERSNANVGGGVAQTSGEILLIHGIGLVTTTKEIGDITIETEDGRPVHVHDVATVVEGHAIRRGVVTAEGRGEVMLGLGFMLMGENTDVVAQRMKDRMEAVKKTLPEGTRVDVVYDRTELVDFVIKTVEKNLFEGALLVVAILFLFLGHLRAALIVAAAIPLSMLFAVNLMVQVGIAGTLMSLGALDFGLIVDSSVVMVENSVRHLQEDTSGRSVPEIVAEASKEVRKPTLFGELIIMIVYVPILALHGVEGKLFAPMALTVIFALLGSLVFSMTLMPVLASLLLTRKAAAHKEPLIIRICKWVYAPMVRFAVNHRVLVLGSALVIVAGTVPIALHLGSIFVPQLDEGSLVINTVRLPGVSIEETARFSTRIEALLKREFPNEIRDIWTRSGSPEVATDPMGIEVSDIFITLQPRAQWRRVSTKHELEKEMDHVLRKLPGMNYSFTQPIEMRVNEMIAGIRTDVGVKVFGDDFEVLKEMTQKIEALLRTVPGTAQPRIEPMVGQPLLQVSLDNEALSRYGLRARDVLEFVQAAGGLEAGEVRVGQTRFPLAVRLPERFTSNPALFGTLMIPAPGGARVPLSRVAKVVRSSGPLVINREWMKRRALVTTNVEDRDLGSYVSEIESRIESELGDEMRAKGCRVEFGGQYENLVRASQTLSYVVPLALLLIFFLVYSTYGTVSDSLRVFTGVPFAMVGGVLALHFREMPFSVSAGVGFIALSGVSVLADMVMVSTIRQHIARGDPVKRAVLAASVQRLRPVLMTALVASLGFVPMALNTGIGAEVQRPLATVVIGGLISSTLLTLFVLPTLYVALKGRREAKWGATSDAEREAEDA
ncbi:MAG: efflux RND transporter permease subunit [Sandaracinus sp.]|nr:efflux RND transporter permease subunit [Planctomycetota bacterium]MCB9610836.1 efflux RND transporter permease subunit [Sandaracinus sp.]